MSFLDQWPFKSREKQGEEMLALEQKCFPLGLAQRDKMAAVLSPLVKGKLGREEKLFCYLCAKEVFVSGGGGDEAAAHAYKKLRELHLKDAEDRRVMVALMRLETQIENLADYPSPEDVLERAELEHGR